MASLVPRASNYTALPQHLPSLSTLSRLILRTSRSSSPFLPLCQRHRLYSSRALSRSPRRDHILTVAGGRPCTGDLLSHHNTLPATHRALSTSRLRLDERLREMSLAAHKRTSTKLEVCVRIAAERIARAKRRKNTIAVLRHKHWIERFRLQLEDTARLHRIRTEVIDLSVVQDSDDVLVTEEHVRRARTPRKEIRDDWHSDFVLLRHTLGADRMRAGPLLRVSAIVMFGGSVMGQVPVVLWGAWFAKRLERKIQEKLEAQRGG